eukprot:TRINITY_DN6468_c0_g1_i2.p1 TRINITY_DN6468_c0_g1~~TRINITY_DN6468_c0_g1_i2.p1  ORF type:complete len:316 (+),score=52.96 TRINITY_DN6468_c0_g1_i2:356-1303(+)
MWSVERLRQCLDILFFFGLVERNRSISSITRENMIKVNSKMGQMVSVTALTVDNMLGVPLVTTAAQSAFCLVDGLNKMKKGDIQTIGPQSCSTTPWTTTTTTTTTAITTTDCSGECEDKIDPGLLDSTYQFVVPTPSLMGWKVIMENPSLKLCLQENPSPGISKYFNGRYRILWHHIIRIGTSDSLATITAYYEYMSSIWSELKTTRGLIDKCYKKFGSHSSNQAIDPEYDLQETTLFPADFFNAMKNYGVTSNKLSVLLPIFYITRRCPFLGKDGLLDFDKNSLATTFFGVCDISVPADRSISDVKTSQVVFFP